MIRPISRGGSRHKDSFLSVYLAISALMLGAVIVGVVAVVVTK